MKKMKKVISFILTMVMVLSMGFSSLADQTQVTGSIKINDAVVGQTYTVYQILDLESYSTTTDAEGNIVPGEAYSYKATTAWDGFINGSDVKAVYVNVDDQGYVTWVKRTTDDADAEAAAAFAKLAQKYAKDNEIASSTASVKATSAEVEFTGLDLGYYLVDTTLGTLCSLDTTNPTVEMYEKNEEPIIEKKVLEDSNNDWGNSNTAEIAQVVYYKTTVKAQPGAESYIVHDVMSDGLTFNEITSIKAGDAVLNEGTDYTVVVGDEITPTCITKDLGACDFHIVFFQTYLNTIETETTIVIEYNATLNENALISADANTNDTKLTYGEDSRFETQWGHTDTYTFKFDLVKTDSDKKVLTGAKFKLYDAETGGNVIKVLESNDGYLLASPSNADAIEEIAVDEGGQAVIKGLDANTTYWLEETEAPAGYNKLAKRVKVEIKEENLTASVLDGVYQDGGVHVENKTGTELPSTGGTGTTIFYVVGGILVLAAVVLLITKKRMNIEE